jgi:hypothetical protein
MLVDGAAQVAAVARVHAREPLLRFAGQLVLGVADHRGPALRVVDPVVLEVPVPEAVVGALRRECVALLATLQGLLGAFALADVDVDGEDAELPVAELDRRAEHAHRDAAAVAVAAFGLVAHQLAADRRLRERSGLVDEVVGDDELGQVASAHLLGRPAEESREARIGVHDAVAVVDEHDAHRRGLEEAPVVGVLDVERLFGPLVVGDVDTQAGDAEHLAVGRAQQGVAPAHQPQLAAAGDEVSEAERHDGAGSPSARGNGRAACRARRRAAKRSNQS